MNDLSVLSPREFEVWAHHLDGLAPRHIARRMDTTTALIYATLRAARMRLSGKRPPASSRKPVNPHRCREDPEIDARIAAEPRCSKCLIGGHVLGDPIRCTSIEQYAGRSPA
jgi:hypothetical protein